MVGCGAVRPWVIALLACLACAAPAAAAEKVTTIAGAPGPGPSKYDKVFVTKFGPRSAKRGCSLELPWAAGVFGEVGALAALKEPTAPAAVQAFPLLPAAFKPPIPATNRGAFGHAFDATTSPKALALIHVQAGMLGANGDWLDGEVSPIERVAQTFAQEPANATEWYFPAKLSIDVAAANALTRNAETRYLKLRPWHRRQVDLPLYALQTDLTGGRVLRGAKRFIAGSKVPRSMLVDASADDSHLDPLTAAPYRNRFLKTVVPFLRSLRPR
jgi:hypothetical protein